MTYRSHEGPIHLPRDIAGLVAAVFGLDNRRMAFPGGGSGVTITPVTPPQIASLYKFPAIPSAIASQTIGIFEFGGGHVTDAAGHATDADLFMVGLNPPLPRVKMFSPPVSILGAPNSPGTPASPTAATARSSLTSTPPLRSRLAPPLRSTSCLFPRPDGSKRSRPLLCLSPEIRRRRWCQ